MDDTAIEAKDLTRKFGSMTAVDHVSFSIKYGEIFGFLGSNGAGKSTTIRMLCGILAPTSGTAIVGGFDVNKDPERVKESIGYVSQKFGLYADLTVEENVEFYGKIYELSDHQLKKRMNEVFQLTGLERYRTKMAGTLSGGWKQRLAVANGILHEPKILFLDEPTAGVDPLSRRALWEMLSELAEKGISLFVTTHYMEEAERCNQIAFISEGQLLKIGKPADLRAGVAGQLIEVECDPLMKASRVFNHIPGVMEITAYGTTLHMNVEDVKKTTAELELLAKQHGIKITSIQPIPASLEDVFATLTEGEHA